MKKRKILSLFLSLCLLIGLLPTVALAADQVATESGVRITEAGYDSTNNILTINVDIKIPNSSGIKTVGSIISYDSSKLTLMHSTKDKTYIPESTAIDADPVVNVKLIDQIDKEYNTDSGVKLYGDTSRAGLFVGLGSTKGPSDEQKTTDWLTIYQLRFKVSGKAADVLNSDSLRIADPAVDNDVIKGAYPANNKFVISVDSGDSIGYKYGKMNEYNGGDVSGANWVMNPENVTATYPGSTNTPPLPEYSGTIAAPTVKTNAGGKVVLDAAVLNPADSSAKIQYGYSDSASTAPTTWQDGTTFSGLTVGDTLYFYAKVVGTSSYAEKVSDASEAVTVADKPAASVTAPPTAKSGLKYDGTEQVLLGFNGTASGGTMQYSLDNSSWSDAIPTGKDAKTYTVYYMAKGDGTHSDSAVDSISVTIGQKEISGVTIGTIANQSYTGGAITPDPEVKDGTATLVKDKDYTVSCSKNTYVGTATLTITGKDNYTGTKNATFAINAVNQNPTFAPPASLVKGGHRLDLRTLVQGAKGDMIFTISGGTSTYANLESDGYTLTSTVYTGTVNINVRITTGDENNDSTPEYNAFNRDNAITVNVTDKTNAALASGVTQSGCTFGETLADPVFTTPTGTTSTTKLYTGTLTKDGSSYSSATKPTEAGTYKVKVKCETATTIYEATSADFTIEPKRISGMTVTLNKTSLEYNGSAQTVTVTVKDGASTLIKDTDYTVTGATSGTNVSSYTVTVTGKGNYKGSVDRTWKITQATPTYTVPTGLTAKYGQTLADVNIAATTGWSWMNTGTAVGTPATKNFPAKFTPTDAINYKTVENINVSVAVSKADAPTLTNIPVSQKYTVTTAQSKDIGRAGMPEDAGNLTYTKGTASRTGSVAINSWSVDATTGKVTYTLSGGAAGDTVTLPVLIGSDNYANATVKVVITLTDKDDQAALTLTGGTTVVYGQTLQLGTTGGNGTGAVTYAVTNGTGEATIDATGKLTPVKVGTVKVTATKAGDASYNSITSAEVEITINKATPTGEPAYTKITEAGKTLTDAALGIGTIMPAGGTIAWDDPTSTEVVANTSYGWTYTPADTNYDKLTGTIELYHKSTGGRYYYSSSNGSGTATVAAPDMPMLYRGCTGDAVKTLQEKLNAKGFDSGNVDGVFGAKTYAAVAAFQKANSLGVDGIVGKLTWGKLYGVSPAMPVETTTVVGRPTVSYGSRGDAVRKLQELLNALGYDCGSVDGIFGSKTKAAVLAFQKANGLGADGIVGPLTWAKLG